MRLTRFSTRPVVFVAFLAAAHVARADLVDCGAIAASPAPYKIVLDDFVIIAPTVDDEATALMDRLKFRLQNQIDQLQKDIGNAVQVRLVTCKGRRPEDDSDFTQIRASTLNSQRVVLEFWGLVDSVDSAPAQREARVRYVIMPLRDHYYNDTNVPALQAVRYPRQEGGSAAATENRLLENLPELTIYALIGIGTKARYAGEIARSMTALVKAEAMVADLRMRGDSEDLKSLFEYIRSAECETAAAAPSDPTHAGLVPLTPMEDCHAPN
jgi:hypothetical protein